MTRPVLDEPRFVSLCVAAGKPRDVIEASLARLRCPASDTESKAVLPMLSFGLPGKRTSLDLMKEIFSQTKGDYTAFCAQMVLQTCCPSEFYEPFWQWLAQQA